jgi:hypothetical protein
MYSRCDSLRTRRVDARAQVPVPPVPVAPGPPVEEPVPLVPTLVPETLIGVSPMRPRQARIELDPASRSAETHARVLAAN